ncbi:hypothetical protein GE21DRAFT_4283 [Neurospora crassa]|uniref:Uncharacterized protein n=1 Tax=Neurospora crassa (strain ATCC 24698 / 74-OR23-1A / CBS 708.71 / DSM 1257 / FGSC 987) TaxID=367110 RepID=Q7RY92_NEUCR|nr:hypothetical protein NCU00013 [Neurospora crassa OR74A]EAA27764.3 hypothetical protein NCU00013 [Neurospora crassa OR74A]KHE84269.1 hypothetical protein GE21DRAFT_4283 [Neurospora crassa]|eukprot:XP_957000.3 hypothetical protein NCU00013 [Neurospora crassa OR74A]
MVEVVEVLKVLAGGGGGAGQQGAFGGRHQEPGIVFKVLKMLKSSTMALSSRGNLATRIDPDQVNLVDVAGFRVFRTLMLTVIMAKLLEEMMVGLFYQMCWFTAKVCCEGFTSNT